MPMPQIPQKRLALILGAVLSLLAIFMVKVYLDQQNQRLRQQAEQQAQEEYARRQAMQTTVLIAAKDLPKGSIIDEGSLESKTIPKDYVEPKAVTAPDRVIGMITAVTISQGEQITLGKLISSQQARGSSLAMVTPVGKRAITIAVDNIASLVGMIKPTDYVDLIGLLPVPMLTADGRQESQMAVVPLFQNVLVLAVGQDLGGIAFSAEGRYRKDEQSGGSSPLITLALTPQEASLIAFVQEQGKIRLTLRSPADSRVEMVLPASWETLFQHIMPPAKADAGQQELQPRAIEIYRGLQKESLTLSKE